MKLAALIDPLLELAARIEAEQNILTIWASVTKVQNTRSLTRS